MIRELFLIVHYCVLLTIFVLLYEGICDRYRERLSLHSYLEHSTFVQVVRLYFLFHIIYCFVLDNDPHKDISLVFLTAYYFQRWIYISVSSELCSANNSVYASENIVKYKKFLVVNVFLEILLSGYVVYICYIVSKH
jgi:hypothetical protein